MRVGSAAAAAAVALCAAVTAADGAGAVAGGPVLAKGEVQAEVDAALGQAGIHDDGTMRVINLYSEYWSGHKPRPECLLDPKPLPASTAQTDRLLAGLERAGWRRAEPPKTAADGRVVNTSLHRGGWHLTVSRVSVSAAADSGSVTVAGLRPDC